MKINSRKLSVEGFAEQASWLGKLLTPLNAFMGQVFTIFQNNITIEDNLFQEIKSIQFVNETSNFPLKFTTKFNKYPAFVIAGTCIDSTNAYTSVYPLIKWTFADGVLSISSISGLTTSHVYTLKLLIIYA